MKNTKSSPKKPLKRFTIGKNKKKGHKETQVIAHTFLNSIPSILENKKEKIIEFSTKKIKTETNVRRMRNKKLIGIFRILNRVDKIKK